MKKIKTILTTVIGVTLITAGFAGAEVSLANNLQTFPYFHFGSLIVAGIIISGLKFKFDKMSHGEAICSFALYALLISLFTEPVVMTIKNLIG